MAHESKCRIASLAEYIGKGGQVLTNRLNPNSDSHYLTIAGLEALGALSQKVADNYPAIGKIH